MSGAEIAQIIASLATLVGVIGGVLVSLHNGQKIREVKVQTDGLVAKTVRRARAQGKKDGKSELLEQQTPQIPGEQQPTNQPTQNEK